MIFKNAFVASAANFHLILVVPMGVREMNWEISVILLFNLTLPAISHPFTPIENSLSGAVLPCLSFVQSQGLSRGLKNRVRVQTEAAWSRKGFVLKGTAHVPSLCPSDVSVS